VPGYRAQVWSPQDDAALRQTFRSLSEARAWRAEAQVQIRRGVLRASEPVTLAEVAETWLEGAREGRIRNRSGDRYKPSVLRGYEQALRLRVLPELGAARLDRIRRGDLQDLVERMLGEGCGPSTIRNTLLPVRTIYRRAVARGRIAVNPTRGLELPSVRGRRTRIASPHEAEWLLAALENDRALWATAMYAGLRMGELRALDLREIDLKTNVIHVRRSWDHVEGPIEPKSRAGRRTVPVPAVLRSILAEHRLGLGRAEGLAFGRSTDLAFRPWSVNARANAAWKRAGLARITLHECRHTYASLMVAAGVNAKALAVYMGHSSVTVTFDLYGHLMPGNEREAAGLLDDFLESAREA
jgi:integrase